MADIIHVMIQKYTSPITLHELAALGTVLRAGDDEATTDKQVKPTIVIDFGHGLVTSLNKKHLHDNGSTGFLPDGTVITERQLIEAYGETLVEELERTGFAVILTNTADASEPFKLRFQDRLDVVHKHQPQLYISLHGNSIEKQQPVKTQFFYQAEKRDTSLPSYEFAQNMYFFCFQSNKTPEHKKGLTMLRSSGTLNSSNGYTSDITKPISQDIPAILIEVGNIKSPRQMDQLLNKGGAKTVAHTLADGITQHYTLMQIANPNLPSLRCIDEVKHELVTAPPALPLPDLDVLSAPRSR